MGQAAVDLPDPLNAPSPADAPVNADDLLAQMAGAEIDRLLAEQEGERTPTMGAPRIVQAPAPTAPLQPASVPNPAAEAKSADAGLKSVLSGIASAPDAGVDPVAKLAGNPQAVPGAKSTAELLDEELAADEARAALSSARFQQNPEAPAAAEPIADIPLPLRALAWVSAPLDACPDHVREAIGKIAIITLVNALAVLFYVLFLRPHHG